MAKTASYTLKAVNNYNAKFDRVTVNLEKGAKDIIRNKTGMTPAAWCKEVLTKELEKLSQSGADQE